MTSVRILCIKPACSGTLLPCLETSLFVHRYRNCRGGGYLRQKLGAGYKNCLRHRALATSPHLSLGPVHRSRRFPGTLGQCKSDIHLLKEFVRWRTWEQLCVLVFFATGVTEIVLLFPDVISNSELLIT